MGVDISVHGALIQVELGLYSWTFYLCIFTITMIGLSGVLMSIVEDTLGVAKTLHSNTAGKY